MTDARLGPIGGGTRETMLELVRRSVVADDAPPVTGSPHGA